MQTIFSPILSSPQADRLFPVDDSLAHLTVPAETHEVLAEILANHGLSSYKPTIEPQGLESACESFVLPDGPEVMVCAIAQVCSGVQVKFLCLV